MGREGGREGQRAQRGCRELFHAMQAARPPCYPSLQAGRQAGPLHYRPSSRQEGSSSCSARRFFLSFFQSFFFSYCEAGSHSPQQKLAEKATFLSPMIPPAEVKGCWMFCAVLGKSDTCEGGEGVLFSVAPKLLVGQVENSLHMWDCMSMNVMVSFSLLSSAERW